MKFKVEFYESAAGQSPLIDFLEDLRVSDPGDHAALVAGLNKLKDPHNHHEPLCEAVGEGIYQLRRSGKLGTSVLWLFASGGRVVVLHGARLTDAAQLEEGLKLAQQRRYDWQRREQG
jgi:hypothetical protein